jgi:phytol kinase
MLQFAVSILFAFFVLIFAEGLLKYSKKNPSPEVSRKLVHMSHGIAAAIWPFFVAYRVIIAIEVLFLILAALARKFHIFKGISQVDRISGGEIFFPLGIIGAALFYPSKWIFAAAMLELALADSAAALIGKKYGKHKFTIFGNQKSLEGSLAFAVVSVIIVGWVVIFAPAGFDSLWPLIIFLPILTALTEAITPFGMDNLLIPLVVVAVLSSLQTIN